MSADLGSWLAIPMPVILARSCCQRVVVPGNAIWQCEVYHTQPPRLLFSTCWEEVTAVSRSRSVY